MDRKKIEIKLSPLFERGIAVFLFLLIGYFLFHFSVFSKNTFTLPGFILTIIFAFFFLEYAISIFVLTLPLLSQVPKLLNLPLFSPSELLFLCLLSACLLKIVLNQKRLRLFQSRVDLPIVLFSFVVITSFLATFITHYPLDFFYGEKVLGVLKRMLFIRDPYDYSYIFNSTFTVLEGVFLFFLITNFVREKRFLSQLYVLLILGWAIAIILGFVQYLGGMLGNERWPTRMFSMFDNPNLFGGYLILTTPLAFFYGIHQSFFKRISLWIFILLSVIALILSRSKNSWVAFGIVSIFMGIYLLVFYSKRGGYKSVLNNFNWKTTCVLAFCFLILSGSLYFYLKRGNVLELLSGDVNWRIPIEQKLDVRLPLWKCTIQMVEDFPIWGVGIGEFNFALQKYSSMFIPFKEATFQAHSYFLQISAELGLIGLFVFLWMLGTISSKGFEITRQKRDVVKLGIWFGIIGFILTLFGDGYLWNIEMQLMFWLLIGLLFLGEEGDEMAPAYRRSFDKRLLIGLSAILLIAFPIQIYQRSQLSFLSERSLGLYQEKFKDEVREYQWGEKVVLMPLELKGNRIHIPMKLGNPDIQEHPVKVKIFFDGQMADRLEFRDHDWHLLQYSIEGPKGSEVILKIEVSRTWNPYLSGVRHETRDLGPALGKIAWSS